MIGAAAFCPHPPLLVPAVAAGAAGELDELREQCRVAVQRACTGRRTVLVGAGPLSDVFDRGASGSLAGYGVQDRISLDARTGEPGPARLPLSVTIGAWLLRESLGQPAVAVSVGADFAGSLAQAALRELTDPSDGADVALVVMADGSARRSTTAPGYLDERAAGYDASVAAALRTGDPEALAALDVELGRTLLAAGARVWPAAGELLAALPRIGATHPPNPAMRYDARLHYDQAPYGVGYLVASWLRRG